MAKMTMPPIIFGRSLREDGYRVEFAVGSTYSLDLDTFISLPFSLGFLEEPDEVMKKSIPYIFSALRLCSDRIAVFCNFSDIKVPPQSRKVYYALMEGSVFPMNVGGKNQIVNFHPKVWVVKQTSERDKKTIIRVIVMSRNLTRDGSLDCACVLTGTVGNKPASAKARKKHQPLVDFLLFMAKKALKKQHRIETLADDILKVESFDIGDSLYDDYEFLPMGITDYSGAEELTLISSDSRVVVISPFIDNNVMARFSNVKEKLLITEEKSVNQAAVDAFGKENVYTMNPQMIDNELDESVHLHAKMYFTTGYRPGMEGQKNFLYLGSTNATMRGFDRNVEFMVRLLFKPYKMSWKEFASFFKDDPEHRFTQMIGLVKGEDSALNEYEQSLALRRAILSVRRAEVIEEGEWYAITLNVNEKSDGTMIYPLMRPDLRRELAPELVFHGIKLIELSEFYVIEAQELKRVIKIPTAGIPSQRDEEICRSVIHTPSQFMDCISFLLSENKNAYVISQMAAKALASGGKGDATPVSFPAVYENLLREAYESPDTFADIQSFVNSLPKDVIPKEFGSMYEMITKAMRSLRR